MVIAWLSALQGIQARPPAAAKDHVQGLPLERDGDLNKQFRRELLLGGSTEPPDPAALLTQVFRWADTSGDSFLEEKELEVWIASQIKSHFKKAIQDNLWTFTTLDKNHDGTLH
ncbi:SDF4 [Cordylochernes scorpioides]|uniref:SDF4 n=1 Tax=Cordylochernes scorpioides TaxID=51811 RepID=A0ABY6LCS8_9ARAC|nr:SDF4 [Cordylochernes scorpioides]